METLWAPWRIGYIKGLGRPKESAGCFFCQAFAAPPEAAAEHLLVGRGEKALVMLNRYPYGSGHLMVAPARHVGNLEEVDESEAVEIWRLMAVCKAVLNEAMQPGGFNLGINQGRCAGAGVLDHLHVHVLPRWEGDTNYMTVVAGVRVLPQSLEDQWAELRPRFAARGL